MSETCYKYTNKYGTVFIECKLKTDKKYSITLGDTQCYSEELLHCPFCGKPLFEYGYARK